MSDYKIPEFYPNDVISCENDLPYEDGTYEVWQRDVILNIFLIKNKRIQYHIQYNTLLKKRLITWRFEYLTHSDNTKIHNIWRQPMDTKDIDLYSSSHWELYPEDLKKRIQHKQNFQAGWNNFTDYVINCAKKDIAP